MNERILELAMQANSHHNFSDLNYRELDVFLEKFAELIVKECAAMTRNLSAHGELAEKAVKEHFGVEE